MALIYSKQLRISGSDLQTGIPTDGGYDIDVLNTTMSIADALNVIAIGSGSAVWSIESDGSISRNSNVEVTGSFIVAGAAKFGDSVNDIHQFTGSVYVSSSIDIAGNANAESLAVANNNIVTSIIHGGKRGKFAGNTLLLEK